MLSSTSFLASLLATTAVAFTLPPCPNRIGAQGVVARLPPAFNTNHGQMKWKAPPLGWYFKPWNMIYASNQQYAAFRNLQYDPTPVDPLDPAGLINDLFSFQLPGKATVITTYGVDTPDPKYPAVYYYNATGIIAGATSNYSMLAWGCDINKAAYYASYSTETEKTNTPSGIDIMSTNDKGPDSATIAALMKALKALPSVEIQELAANLTRMTQDGDRNGSTRIGCDDYCKSNQNLLELIGQKDQ